MVKTRRLMVLALGGNALLGAKEKGTISEQEANAARTAKELLPILQADCDLVITHGNGPQVGNILIQNESAANLVPAMPIDVCVAKSQGSIGYILQQAILNELRRNKIPRYVVTMITQAVVDKKDPAFKNPTKPVGPFFDEEKAKILEKERKWQMKEDSGRGYRRVIASPMPIKVIQRPMIHDLARDGHIVIAAGGGSIPIWKKEDNEYEGIEAVIDKDIASAILAREMKAETLIILTAVPKVCLNFGKPSQTTLDIMSASLARQYIKEGHFGSGSMAPKIEAALLYLEQVDGKVVITSSDHLKDVMTNNNYKSGTTIFSDIKYKEQEGNLLIDFSSNTKRL